MKLGTGNPTEPGVYACRQWYGWRVLEWRDGKWQYQGAMASWPKEADQFEAWCGPLPVQEDKPVPAAKPLPIVKQAAVPPLEYDL